MKNTSDSLLVFPCDFPIKVFGLAESKLEEVTVGIIQQEFPHFDPKTIQHRHSQEGKYLSLSITIHADSKAQIDRLYQQLSSAPAILMVL